MQVCRWWVLWGVSATLLVQAPEPVRAQSVAVTTVAITPSVGLGPIFDHGDLVSWSANVLVDLGVTRAPWRWSVFASARGFGAACADSCDLSGEALGLGVERLVRGVSFGGGVAGLRQSGAWYFQPVGMVSVTRGRVRAQLRVEAPRGGFGVNIPILFGVRIPVPGVGAEM